MAETSKGISSSFRNGLKLKEMLLEDWHAPDREALIEELDERRSKATASRPHRRAAA